MDAFDEEVNYYHQLCNESQSGKRNGNMCQFLDISSIFGSPQEKHIKIESIQEDNKEVEEDKMQTFGKPLKKINPRTPRTLNLNKKMTGRFGDEKKEAKEKENGHSHPDSNKKSPKSPGRIRTPRMVSPRQFFKSFPSPRLRRMSLNSTFEDHGKHGTSAFSSDDEDGDFVKEKKAKNGSKSRVSRK